MSSYSVHKVLILTCISRCTACFNTWSIFSEVLRDCEMPTMDLLRYRQHIKKPTSPLPMYTEPLTSDTFHFITSLSITTTFSVPDLLKLTKITNLGILEIIASDVTHGMSDRIIREWHHDSLNEGAFQVLRILKLWNHEDVTRKSLEYVTSFPSLAIYDIRGCTVRNPEASRESPKHDWTLSQDKEFLDHLHCKCRDRTTKKAHSQPVKDDDRIDRISRGKRDVAVRGMRNGHNRDDHEKPEIQLTRCEQSDLIRLMNTSSSELPLAFRAWDFEAFSAFTRVGALRNDEDLARAGVNIGDDEVFVSGQIMNPVPMASLCLGPLPSTSSKPQRRFTFIRTKMLPKREIQPQKLDETLAASNTRSIKRQGHGKGVMRAKKRKLDDVLGSFL